MKEFLEFLTDLGFYLLCTAFVLGWFTLVTLSIYGPIWVLNHFVAP